MIALKKKKWLINNCLPHSVTLDPSGITGEEYSVKFIRITDSEIIIDVSRPRYIPLIYFFMLVFGGGAVLDVDRVIASDIVVAFVSLALSLFALLWFIFHKKKYVTFDRDRTIVSLPGPFWFQNIDIPFKEVIAVARVETYYFAHLKVLNLYRPDGYKVNVGINSHSLESLKRDWAFYVWYMDKSKPLPPAPVFDKLRNSANDSPTVSLA